MSEQNRNPSGQPEGAGAADQSPESARAGVLASHGEREKRAYVAPVEVPKPQHRRLHTIDMSKVRISPDMKVSQLDPRHMPTQKMDLPPGGIRPLPPPPNTEIADGPGSQAAQAAQAAGASPWSQNAGIDRSMLPSAAMAPAVQPQTARPASVPPPSKTQGNSIGMGVWIAVIVVAALLGGGIALALRSRDASTGAEPAGSNMPISIGVPATGMPAMGATPSEPDTTDGEDAEVVPEASAEAATTSTAPKTTRTTVPRRTTTTKPTTTATAAPTTTTTAPKRLFN